MDLLSHFLFGLITANLTLQPLGARYIILATIMAGLPDADVLLTPFRRYFKSYYFSHRGGSHSYLTAIFIGAIAALIAWLLWHGNFFLLWLIATLFYSLHLSIDYLTTYKTPLLYPAKKTEYRFDIERAVNPYLMLVSLGIELTLLISFFTHRSAWTAALFNNIIMGLAAGYYGYIIYRLLLYLAFKHNAIAGESYLPALGLLTYYVYRVTESPSEISYSLEKRHAFNAKSTPTVLLNEAYPKAGENYLWIQKAMAIAKNSKFFKKWEFIIPRVLENHSTPHQSPIKNVDGDQIVPTDPALTAHADSEINVQLLLAEGFSGSFGYVMEIAFNRHSQAIISIGGKFARVPRTT